MFCTFDVFHNKIRNDSSEQVCDSCWIRHGGMNPSRNTFLGRNFDPRRTSPASSPAVVRGVDVAHYKDTTRCGVHGGDHVKAASQKARLTWWKLDSNA